MGIFVKHGYFQVYPSTIPIFPFLYLYIPLLILSSWGGLLKHTKKDISVYSCDYISQEAYFNTLST